MIILEFRFREHFHSASSVLKRHKIPCVAELGMEDWRPSYIFLFEDALRTDPQRRALGLAREFEKEDRRKQMGHPQSNLAIPL